MSTNKIDRAMTGDAQALARFQQTQRAAQESARPGETEAPQGAAQAAAADKVEISEAAQRLESLRGLVDAGRASLENEPEIRADRVAEVKRSLEAGAYETRDAKDALAAKLAPVLRDLDALLD